MKEQKNIDRLFQEKFKNFEATPDDAIWNRIESKLQHKKEDRKGIPIWWKIGGIAAGLVLLFTIGYAVINNTNTTENNPTEFVDTENPTDTKTNNAVDRNSTEQNKSEENVLNNNLISEDDALASETSSKASEDALQHKTDSHLEKSNQTVIKNKSTIVNDYNKKPLVNSNRITNNNNSDTNKFPLNSTTDNNYKNKVSNQDQTGIVTNNNIPQHLPELQPAQDHEKQNTANTTLNSSTEEGIPAITNIEKEDLIKATTDEGKTSIEDAIATSEDEEDINEKEKDVIDRWSVTPNVAPVYYNTLGSKGSSIHSQFNNNSKSGDLNMSYGVTAAYALSDRFAVRTGVSRVNVGYKTNEVVVYQNVGTAANNNDLLRNIKLDPASQNTSIISSESLAFAEVPEIVIQNFKASLNQDISFIEVPVEVEYKLLDKKVDINLIGGFSTMFLNDNTIYAEIFDEATPIGEANNINDVSFSANFGIGLEVKISKRVNLNLEPTFKYQINTFNNTSGDFKPYIMGVNSGLKFKF